MNKENCIFCKIVKKEIPCAKVYEDDDVIAFLDISQTTKGHTLVVSKEHYDNILATPKDIMHRMMDVAQQIGQAQIQNLHAKGVNILTNCYAAAGQTVGHVHIHVIPRYKENDNLTIEFRENKEIETINLPQLAEQINKNF